MHVLLLNSAFNALRFPCATSSSLHPLTCTQVVGPALPALRQFAARLLANPQAVWPRRLFGTLDVMPSSAWVALAAPVSPMQLAIC